MPRRAFSLVEIVVVVGIIAVLSGVTVPAVQGAVRAARRLACANHLRQVGLCALAYGGDWEGRLPAEGTCGILGSDRSPAWFDRLPEYLDEDGVGNRGIFQCSAYRAVDPLIFHHASPKSYKMNAYLDALGRHRHYRLGSGGGESQVVLFADAVAGETGMGQWGHCPASAVSDVRHHGAINIVALDGHTQAAPRTPGDGDWGAALTWLPHGWEGGPR